MPNQMIVKVTKNKCFCSEHEYKVAACLYKGSNIINLACNSSKHISYRKKYFIHGSPTKHAEIAVLNNLSKETIKGCSLLVVRVNAKGEFTSAKPCFACAKALYDSNIRRVYYSNYDGDIVKLDLAKIDFNNYQKEQKLILP